MVDGGDEGVEQARIMAPAVEVAESLEQLLGVLAAQIVGPLDPESQQLPGDGRADVG
jgi:hypothetical protein